MSRSLPPSSLRTYASSSSPSHLVQWAAFAPLSPSNTSCIDIPSSICSLSPIRSERCPCLSFMLILPTYTGWPACVSDFVQYATQSATLLRRRSIWASLNPAFVRWFFRVENRMGVFTCRKHWKCSYPVSAPVSR